MTSIKAILGLLLAAALAGAFALASSARSTAPPRMGALHVTKECSQYFGHAGEFCTITSSNLSEIEPGMNVIYASAAGPRLLNSDLVLDGPGDDDAYGHVTLNFRTLSGVVTFLGGTGRFSGIYAHVAVTLDTETGLWHWDGMYRFVSHG
jgi:hypothetical protein